MWLPGPCRPPAPFRKRFIPRRANVRPECPRVMQNIFHPRNPGSPAVPKASNPPISRTGIIIFLPTKQPAITTNGCCSSCVNDNGINLLGETRHGPIRHGSIVIRRGSLSWPASYFAGCLESKQWTYSEGSPLSQFSLFSGFVGQNSLS